ncbi:hypothetical protein KHQ81_09255 [Mycoplasmatota bacterium]|nr:hypothetical protein KHQ81_09255 [Mycoplasmatota bacterium]
MFLSLFFKIIAILFFILFLIKLFSPRFFPFIIKGYETVIKFCNYTFKLLIRSSIYTVNLLFTRTVYIIGLDLLFALLFNILLTIYVYPHYNLKIWFSLFKTNLINSYVLSFFVCTYLIGLYEYLKVKKNININIYNFIQKKLNKASTKQGSYTYDDQTNKYTYHD